MTAKTATQTSQKPQNRTENRLKPQNRKPLTAPPPPRILKSIAIDDSWDSERRIDTETMYFKVEVFKFATD